MSGIDPNQIRENDTQLSPIDYKKYGRLYSSWARYLSLISALILSSIILVAPHLIAETSADLKHGVLSFCLWGICAGYVHGVGYVPTTHVWRWVLSPYAGWPIMIVCFYLWLIP